MSSIDPKAIYRRNMVQLTSDLRVDSAFMAEMIEAGVFTEANSEEVMGEREKGNNRKFINILNGRGLRGFNAFIKALVKTLQHDLADSLHKQKAEEARKTLGLVGQSVQANAVFQFEKDKYYGCMGEVVATVVRDSSEGEATIEYSTIDGSAKGGKVLESGVDYVSVQQGTLTFKQGETSHDIFIEVNEQITGSKVFNITLKNPSNGAKTGTNSSTAVHIKEEEALMQFEVKRIDSSEAKKVLARKRVYQLKHRPRGRVLIINNNSFDTKLAPRDSSVYDVSNLENLFKQLYFKGETEENQKAQEMRDLIQAEIKRDHSEHDAFFLIVMSHGREDSVYGADGELVNIEEDIIKPFRRAKGLKGKPKVFLFQACRTENKGHVTSSEAVTNMEANNTASRKSATLPRRGPRQGTTTTDAAPVNDHEPMDTTNASTQVVTSKTPPEAEPEDLANFIKVNSAVPGQSAHNVDLGSWFIREFIKATAKYAHQMHLLDILTEMSHRIKDKTANEHMQDPACHGKQCCQTDSRGFDVFHFLPGYYVEK